MKVAEISVPALARLAIDEAEYDFWTFEDGNVLNGYECSCGRCVN